MMTNCYSNFSFGGDSRMNSTNFLKTAALLAMLLSGITSSMAMAESQVKTDGTASMPPDNRSVPVNRFLAPDGHFDMKAAKASGYQGKLNFGGYNIRLDPRTGEPIVGPSVSKPTISEEHSDSPDDIYWDSSISPFTPGADGEDMP